MSKSKLQKLIMYNKTPKLVYIPQTGETFRVPAFRSGLTLEQKMDWIIANNDLSVVSEEALMREVGLWSNPVRNLYKSFHGSKSKGIRKVKYNAPKPGETLIKIGRLARLEYEPEFPSKHTGVRFFHVMGDTGETKLPSNTILATDTKGENLYILKDKPKKRPYFSGRGIIG